MGALPGVANWRRRFRPGLGRWLALSAIGLSAAAQAQPSADNGPVELAGSSPWWIETTGSTCFLERRFGNDQAEVTSQFAAVTFNYNYRISVVSEQMTAEPGDITVAFLPDASSHGFVNIERASDSTRDTSSFLGNGFAFTTSIGASEKIGAVP